MPIVGGQYTDSMVHFRRLLSKKLEKATWWKSKWSPFIGWIDKDKYKKVGSYGTSGVAFRPTGNLIDVVKEFEREGSVYMDVPILYPLTNQPTFGAQRLRGREEVRKILNKKVAINQIRHGIQLQDNKMSSQVLKKPEVRMALMEKGTADLQDWFSRWLAMQPYFSLLHGFSDNLTDGSYGVNMTPKSHPNFYVAETGKATWSDTPATYELNVGTALAGLTNTANDYFSTKVIRNMIYLARTHRIQPVKLNGSEYYLIWIHPAQARQLQADTDWKNAQLYANVRGKDNPLFTGVIEAKEYEGALIMIDDTIPHCTIRRDESEQVEGVNYGVSGYMANPRSTGALKPAILTGAGAITAGYGSELEFASEDDDYMQFLGEGAGMICGFERADIIDSDGYFGTAGKFYENTSSLVYATYSPDAIAF